MKKYIGAIDQGTTSTRFMVFDADGRIVTVAQKEHQQIYPQPGWVEHDPAEIIACTLEVADEAVKHSRISPGELAAVGITNQRETTIVWERKTGKAIANAIVWQDTRVANEVARFSASGGQDRFREATGLPLSTYFSGLKARWLVPTTLTLFVACGLGWWLMKFSSDSTERLLKGLFGWAVFWLILGLCFEPYEGGIKKDKCADSIRFEKGLWVVN